MNLWKKFRDEFAHAFALTPTGVEFSQEDMALLEKIASLIVNRGMATPAILFLESLGPLNFLGSQIVHGLKPFLEVLCDPREMERLAVVLERRDSLERLISLLQEHSATSS